jgi:glucose/arabinose dehydrogenase
MDTASLLGTYVLTNGRTAMHRIGAPARVPRALVSAALAALILTALVAAAGCSQPPAETYQGVGDAGADDADAGGEDVAGESAGDVPIPPLRLDLRWDGFEQPLHLTHAGDGSGRVFVSEKTGRAYSIDAGGTRALYLDLSADVSTNSERGLLSIAFSPAFADDAAVYASYTDRTGTSIVSRFTEVAGRLDAGSETVLLAIEQPYANHNGGLIAFGPDGHLYVGLGDGGSGGDPGNRAQDQTTLLGKMLRIDVSGAGYAIPPDNPFADGADGRPEIWALGLRNPWRFSFDRVSGDLWIGDVGQNAWEEIDRQPGSSDGGENYGWRVFEGTHVFEPDDPAPKAPVEPVHEYPRGDGVSVTGGFVYRGEAMPGLQGVYVFGDYGSGTVWGLEARDGAWERTTLFDTDLSIASFGEDESGELYVIDIASGGIYGLVAAD